MENHVTKLYIEIMDGLIAGVSTDNPELFKDVELMLIDHDTEGCDDADLGLVRETIDGVDTEERSWVRYGDIEPATITQALTPEELDQIVEDKHAAQIADADVPDPKA